MPATISEIMKLSVGELSLGRIFAALITALLCLLVIRGVMKVVRRLLSATKLESRVQGYIAAAMRLVLYIIAALIVIDSLGIPVTSLVALLSVGSLGITLAAEDILGNVAGGLVILSSHPFQIGDVIEVSGTAGTVRDISLNHTKLETGDGLLVLLPNQELASSQITNYSALGRRRVVVKVTASYDAPTATVKTACEKAFSMTERILSDPAATVALTNYGASSIEYTLYCWVAPGDYWAVYHSLNEHLRTTFDEAGVEMTYDHLNIHILDNKA